MDILNQIFSTLVAAIQGSTAALVTYGLPILGFAALVMWFYLGGLELAMSEGGSLGHTLGGLIQKVVWIGIFYWIFVHWQDLLGAILETMIFFAQQGGGSAGNAAALLQSPAPILEMGQQAVRPLVDYSSWSRGLASTWQLATNPFDLISVIAVLAAFLVMTLHYGMLLVEVNLAIALGVVLLPWSLLRPLGNLGELAIGWITGCMVRVLVSVAVMGLALPLVTMLAAPLAAASPSLWDNLVGAFVPTMAPKFGAMLALVGGSLLFLLLAVVVPNRAGRLAGYGLSLSGSDMMATAATGARFSMASVGVIRGTSQMLQRA